MFAGCEELPNEPWGAVIEDLLNTRILFLFSSEGEVILETGHDGLIFFCKPLEEKKSFFLLFLLFDDIFGDSWQYIFRVAFVLILRINIVGLNIFIQLGENILDHFNSIFSGEDMDGIYFFKWGFNVAYQKLFGCDECWKNLCFKFYFFMMKFFWEQNNFIMILGGLNYLGF